jgi:hypothetical protein
LELEGIRNEIKLENPNVDKIIDSILRSKELENEHKMEQIYTLLKDKDVTI